MKISLEHTVEEVNYILAALASKPYSEVKELIEKIHAAGSEQFSKAQAVVQEVEQKAEEVITTVENAL